MLEGKKAQTTDTYNKSADVLALKFDTLGARVNDIKETFALIDKKNPKTLEIGCGNGRDVEEIIKHTNDYLGIDISEKLIELARKKVPQAKFEIADVETYTFPENLDVVFAFASLIHVSKENLKVVFDQIFENLNPGGVVRMSMKQSDLYSEVTNEDEFGIRTYYHYSLQDIKDIAKQFVFIKSESVNLRGQGWLEIILKK